ncbi:MAG: UvrD-helicase domain-containing protein, partial [Syntrophomonas sp.]|nr:UvrD-helicase domain-containing protein [Syntrophomonas sp.]
MREWTEEQEHAITARNTNLLVAAAAGSGKTAVLVERIIQLIIKDKVNIDRMLVATFTHAAAGEMRERISTALMAELENKDENEEHLRSQMNLLNRASISTLHAFCTDVVRKYFHLIDVDPNFRIGDTTETSIMKLEAIEELLENEYAKAAPPFLSLVEMFGGGKDDAPLQNLVLKTYDFIQSKPNPLAWLETRAGDFNMNEEEFARCPWVESLTQQLRINLVGARDLFSEALQITEMLQGPQAYQPALIEDVQTVEQLLKALGQGLPSLYDQVAAVQYPRMGRAGKDTDAVLQEEVKELRAQGKKVIETIQSKILFQSPEQFRQDLNELYPEIEYLYTLVSFFAVFYRDKKSDKGIVDFNDLEHYALAILARNEVAEEYQRKYAYIFVDEYQDSNLVQEIILNCIKKEDNLFLVGDVKQSIYRFRLADPSLFMEKYTAFPSSLRGLDRRIDLRKNFRSRREIIEGINCIFRQIMSRDFGEIDYDEDAYLYPGVDCPDATLVVSDSTLNGIRKDAPATLIVSDSEHQECPKGAIIIVSDSEHQECPKGDTSGDTAPPTMEIYLIEKKPEIPDPDGEPVVEQEAEEPGALEVEARVVAARILELCGQPFYDSQQAGYRPLEYRDIVILMRATRQRADVFSETFRGAGIPVYADVDRGYFQTLEINIFMNLLKVIDNKRQDIPLLSVLRSPIGRFTIDELISIRVGSHGATYYEALEEYLAKHSDDLQVKLQSFLDKLNTWKEAARYTAMDELIWKLLLETGYYYYVGAMPGGMQRQANLRVLFNRASQFQTTSLKGLFHFIKFVDKMQAGSGDMGMAKILGENDNVVRIMSIHKSKGLEFPVVIIAGMGNGFNLSDTKASVLFHKDLGIGPCYVNPELRINKDTIARVAMKNMIKMESMAEEMRILYVACTRARDKLIMVGSLSDLPRRAKTWSKKISPFQLAQARCHLDWVGPVVLRHRDGLKVRELSGVNIENSELSPEEFRWKVEIISRSQVAQAEGQQQPRSQNFQNILQDFQPTNISLEQELIEQRLNWHYPYGEAVQIPSKLSVSQIKNMQTRGVVSLGINIPQMLKRPRFISVGAAGLGGTYFSGAEKGSIMHFVMQHLDFQRVTLGTQIGAQIQEMVKQELLREEEAQLVDVARVLKFFRSDLGQRILQAGKVYREVPFNLVCRASDIIAGWEQCEEELLVQGVID